MEAARPAVAGRRLGQATRPVGDALGGVALALGLFVVTRPSRPLAASAIVASLATVALLFATRGSLFHHLYERLYFKKKFSADTEFAETSRSISALSLRAPQNEV